MVTDVDEKLDRTFAALAHPIRRSILGRLSRGGAASVTDLAEPFDVSLMAVSKHLKVMEEAGLIQRERQGRTNRCSYDPAAFDAATSWIERHRAYWAQQLDGLAAYLENSSVRPESSRAEEPATTENPGGER